LGRTSQLKDNRVRNPPHAKWRLRLLKIYISLGKFDPSRQLSQLAEGGRPGRKCFTFSPFWPSANSSPWRTGPSVRNSIQPAASPGHDSPLTPHLARRPSRAILKPIPTKTCIHDPSWSQWFRIGQEATAGSGFRVWFSPKSRPRRCGVRSRSSAGQGHHRPKGGDRSPANHDW
jgi:hypothetical protein